MVKSVRNKFPEPWFLFPSFKLCVWQVCLTNESNDKCHYCSVMSCPLQTLPRVAFPAGVNASDSVKAKLLPDIYSRVYVQKQTPGFASQIDGSTVYGVPRQSPQYWTLVINTSCSRRPRPPSSRIGRRLHRIFSITTGVTSRIPTRQDWQVQHFWKFDSLTALPSLSCLTESWNDLWKSWLKIPQQS